LNHLINTPPQEIQARRRNLAPFRSAIDDTLAHKANLADFFFHGEHQLLDEMMVCKQLIIQAVRQKKVEVKCHNSRRKKIAKELTQPALC
jgi:uncharacterized protein YijF (DUF1287 family)